MNIIIFKEQISDESIEIHFHCPLRGEIHPQFTIEADFEYELTKSDEAKYYSPKASEFADFFYKLKFKLQAGKLCFYYYKYDKQSEEYTLSPSQIKPRRLSIFANDKQFEPLANTPYTCAYHNNQIMILQLAHGFVNEKLYGATSNLISEDIYLFHDRRNKADDNAEALYRYYMQKQPEFFKENGLYYVIEQDCPDYKRLQADGFKVVGLNTHLHKILYYNAKAILTANALPRSFNPFGDSYMSNTKAKLIALNHGVISNDLGAVLNRTTRHNDLTCTVGKYDYELYKRFSGFDTIKITGLARFDHYDQVLDENFIMYFPTWNKQYARNLYNSQFYKEIINFITDQDINDMLLANDITMKVVFHPLLNAAILENPKVFSKVSKQIEFVDVFSASFKYLLGANKLLITDSSSIRYDNLYQYKNVITYAPYNKNNGESQFDESKMFYDAKTIEQVRFKLEQLIYDDFATSSQIKAVSDDFFAIAKGENCQTIANHVKQLLAKENDEISS